LNPCPALYSQEQHITSYSLWEKTFGTPPNPDLDFLHELPSWKPSLSTLSHPEDHLFWDSLAGNRSNEIALCSRRELVIRSLDEKRENEKRKKRLASTLTPLIGMEWTESEEDDSNGTERRERMIERLIEEMIRESPRQLCCPINITPATDLFRNALIPLSLQESSARLIRAYLCASYWWKYGWNVPAAIRDLVWMVLFTLCYASLHGDKQRFCLAKQLFERLQNGRWPIGMDDSGLLIILRL
jgi:hypothetical protein